MYFPVCELLQTKEIQTGGRAEEDLVGLGETSPKSPAEVCKVVKKLHGCKAPSVDEMLKAVDIVVWEYSLSSRSWLWSRHCWAILADMPLQCHTEDADRACGLADQSGSFINKGGVKGVLPLSVYNTAHPPRKRLEPSFWKLGSEGLPKLRSRRKNADSVRPMKQWTKSLALQSYWRGPGSFPVQSTCVLWILRRLSIWGFYEDSA